MKKGGGRKIAKEKQRETLKSNKDALLRGKTGFFSIRSKGKETKIKKDKEGLGPSEVALRATSPDPTNTKTTKKDK